MLSFYANRQGVLHLEPIRMVGRFDLHPNETVLRLPPTVEGGQQGVQSVIVNGPLQGMAAQQYVPLNVVDGQIRDNVLARTSLPAFGPAPFCHGEPPFQSFSAGSARPVRRGSAHGKTQRRTAAVNEL